MAANGQANVFLRLFEDAHRDFRNGLTAKKYSQTVYDEVLRIRTREQLHAALRDLQHKQKDRGDWAHLERLSPLLDRLQNYVNVVDRFVQAKPELLALIWGPITLILMWSSELRDAHKAVIELIAKFGLLLPQLEDIAKVFVDESDKRYNEYLILVYGDILDFHLAAIRFFSKPAWKLLFSALWTAQKAVFERVEGNLQAHINLLRDETTFEHIRQAHAHMHETSKNFEFIKENQKSHEFRALEVEICPKNNAKKMDQLRNRARDGTGTWLLKNEIFQRWLAFRDQSQKNLWIQGIPGAGKTFLAYWAIRQAQLVVEAKTAYFFADYRDETISALSIVLSLLIQITEDNSDLQAVLTNPNERSWKTGLEPATALLQAAIETTGYVFFVVDGIDEVDEIERRLFLKRLLRISAACDKLKVCISSRSASDIQKFFGASAETILVHQNNYSSIRSYVHARLQEWMSETVFLKQAQREIQDLFSAIPMQSKGMVLYARIVIDNVILLNDVSEIKNELNAAPRDLNEAYDRILRRIDALPPARHRRVKRMLGWIACSPMPLTLLEIEQALLVHTSRSSTPIVESSLDIVGECGPIVELWEGTPQFVHFTAKEYIADTGTRGHINISLSSLNLLETCLAYLSCDELNDDLQSDEIERHIKQGRYRFVSFAASYWFRVLQRCIRLIRNGKSLETMGAVLQDFARKRTNPRFNPDATTKSTQMKIFEAWPSVQKLLNEMVEFEADDRRDSWTLTPGNSWENYDPTTVSTLLTLIEDRYNELACAKAHKRDSQGVPKIDLQLHYGRQLYKCHYLNCERRRTGFIRNEDCEKHKKCHDRPFKCATRECPYSELGFLSGAELYDHTMKHIQRQDITQSNTAFTDKKDTELLLFELVENDDIKELKRIWPFCQKKFSRFAVVQLIINASRRGSLHIVQLLASFVPDDIFDYKKKGFEFFYPMMGSHVWAHRGSANWLQAVLSSNNKDLIKWTLDQSKFWILQYYADSSYHCYYSSLIAQVAKSSSLEFFRMWKDSVLNMDAIYMRGLRSAMGKAKTMREVAKNPLAELELMDLWRQLAHRGDLDESSLGTLLCAVAQAGQSLSLAQCLLELGAPINFPHWPGKESEKGMTPLHHAAHRSSKPRADLIKFLLLQGADHKLGYGPHTPRKEYGASDIKRHLSMDWNELICWASEERTTRQGRTEVPEGSAGKGTSLSEPVIYLSSDDE